ncbi:MAG: DUF2089 family protein [Alphaproteobacteria bacterium]|nr:DUF2089 family protein [Alphaproteobacteria bacterium]
MRQCVNCATDLEIEKIRCPACGLGYEGHFALPRLARLETAHYQLAEQIIMAAGNLKQVAEALEVSYPTLRKRVDGLIEALGRLKSEDQARGAALLDEVEAGRRTPEEAARLVKELNGVL